MSAINKIYSNDLGISFFWKRDECISTPKIQLVFRDIGFLLSLPELKDFSDSCSATINSSCCSQCENPQHCRSLLLRTPSDKIDLAVNRQELYQIRELINGTIYRVELKYWTRNLCLN
ncbi:hypothetical protein [Aquimarina muelleri]|uniref:Uncharacterized protein n=1 Tax=Aquimarina muelleri TaxID=279356 RepID=A0A918JV44_9FLAO|nr:hypothetical protein [Aquimarina muelleri]MCX2761660.1 hypothetical protein [Aquimarina muelleri]GGX07275.1 hypothetical protein GCM10007384_06040 [Aquimarina muelleri]